VLAVAGNTFDEHVKLGSGLDRALHRVRPVAVAALIADSIRETCDDVARAAASPDSPDLFVGTHETDQTPTQLVTSRRAGALQAIDGDGLVRFARTSGCSIVLLHTVGDFVARGAPLFAVYGDAGDPSSTERRLHRMVALGNERTIDQDPAFGIRIMVDIANMVLSPAVNDPTTAVQTIDHLGETLRMIGTADVKIGHRTALPPVAVPTRRWDDFVILAVTEIREYGAVSVQVTRRLRAMLEAVHRSVPDTASPDRGRARAARCERGDRARPIRRSRPGERQLTSICPQVRPGHPDRVSRGPEFSATFLDWKKRPVRKVGQAQARAA
jgi:uncharacterized membrane protein